MQEVENDALLGTLFTNARSHNGWRAESVSDAELRAAYDLAKWGPTSMNTQPMRVLFLKSQEAKERLIPALAPTNIKKALTAPVVAIIAYDSAFYTQLPRTFPHNLNAQGYFLSNEAIIAPTALRNGSLQAAYLMMALRGLGLDVGPMSGFIAERIDVKFFSGTSWRVNFICGIGHGDPAKLYIRSPRLEFEEVASIL